MYFSPFHILMSLSYHQSNTGKYHKLITYSSIAQIIFRQNRKNLSLPFVTHYSLNCMSAGNINLKHILLEKKYGQ